MGLDRMYATDDTLREVASMLYGDGAEELVSKLSHAQEKKKLERRQAKIGLASNIVGLGAGVAGTAAALRDPRFKEGGKLSQKLAETGEKLPSPISGKKGRIGAYLAGGALGLQVANIAGDAVANRVLARSAQPEKKKGSFAKMEPCGSDLSISNVSTGKLKRMAGKKALQIVNENPHVKTGKVEIARKKKELIGKSFTWEGEFSKVDEDKRQVFGWASITEMNGEPVYDLQGDYIDTDEIEKSAYDYVIKSRKGGDMHRRNADDTPVHSSDMIESFMVTPEKVSKMGLPEGALPTGWWVGFQVNDDDAWNLVKTGKRTAFSIHGRGQRTPLEG